MHIDVLGPLRAVGPAGRVPVPAGRASGALCWLALHANQAVTADSLAAALWPDPPASAGTRARTLLRSLEPVLEPGTLEIGATLRLVVDEDAVDARRFERLAGEAAGHQVAGDAERARATLRDALALWRGAPCPDLAGSTPARRLLDRLVERRLRAQEDLNALELHLGIDYPGVADLRAQTVLNPERPRLQRQLALALYLTDRQVEALEVLRRLRSTWGDPDGLAGQLQAAMLRHDPGLAAGEPLPAG